MKQFIGVKIIHAEPMTRGDYNKYRGWTIPENENPNDKGYLVKYSDDYISWSPENAFDEAYRETDGCMTFGLAIEAGKQGFKIARKGWNGQGMFVVLMPALYLPPFNTKVDGEPHVNYRTAKHIGLDAPLDSQPYFAMWTAQKKWQPGWLASQADMLAEDWQIVS